MVKYNFLLLVLLTCILSTCNNQQSHSPGKKLHTLAFGSCFKHRIIAIPGSEVIFDSVREQNPDSWVWLGDFAYLDELTPLGFRHNSIEEVKSRLYESYNDPYYKKLRESSTKIYGIWDDHDSGINDGGKHNPMREEIRQLWLDVFDEPKNSPRRTQKGGMYASYYLDEAKKVKLILLDNRYDNDEKKLKNMQYEEKCNLGDEQRQWLRREIENSTAEYTIVAAGVQILSDDRPCELFYPKTKNFLLGITNPNTKMFFLSGDVHHAEFLVDECSHHIHGYNLREFVSSGLTHGMGTMTRYGVKIGHLVSEVHDLISPDTFTEYMDQDKMFTSKYYGNNYGLVEIFENQVVWTIRETGGNIIHQKILTELDFQSKSKPDYRAWEQCKAKRKSRLFRRVKYAIVETLTFRNKAIALIGFILIVLFKIVKIFFFILRRTICRKKESNPINKEKYE